MSLDLTILQKGIIKKTLPLSVILGDRLHYGSFDESRRLREKQMGGQGWFVAYLPQSIGRGIRIGWTEGEKEKMTLRLLYPTAQSELQELAAIVDRVLCHWRGELLMDGEKTSPDRWEESRAGLLRYNREQLQAVCRILARQDSFHGDLMESALWPLCVGPQEAEAFLENPEAFDLWLHEKQSVDAFYSQPKYYQRAGEAIGVYSICEEFRCIFPRDPAEAAQAMEALKRGHKAALVGANSAARTNLNPVTGSPWALEDFRVLFLSYQEDRKLGVNRYQDFLDRLPPEKFSPYDATHILIEPMTTEELQAYFEL